MRIGLKYCGGCNPRYDRARIAARLRQDFPRAEILPANETDAFDFIVVICGCNSRCAAHTHLQGRMGKLVLAEENDYAQLRAMLTAFSE